MRKGVCVLLACLGGMAYLWWRAAYRGWEFELGNFLSDTGREARMRQAAEMGDQAADAKMELDSVPFRETWEAMEAVHALGLCKEIGVCNFNTAGLRDLLSAGWAASSTWWAATTEAARSTRCIAP